MLRSTRWVAGRGGDNVPVHHKAFAVETEASGLIGLVYAEKVRVQVHELERGLLALDESGCRPQKHHLQGVEISDEGALLIAWAS
ncbi:hypothetical protein EYC58_05175 [Candidatus Saccharibacteria bacterium]|nr:MAG: hypothetical protein EYC58_05175 [Candidatus Saccharibacteria bacterium]